MAARRAKFWMALALAGACQSTPAPEPSRIRVGMTKPELLATLGNPVEQGAPAANERGRLEEVWLYDLAPDVATGRDVAAGVLTSGVGFFDDPTAARRYRFVFVDDRLASWAPAAAK